VNIDVELIRRHDGETISLANGCMCCSLVNGFAQAIGQIRARADAFDHLVIEASGVADPAKIAQYGQMHQLPLDGILVVVDAEQVRTQAENKYVGDTVLRQLAQADLLVLNKTDLASADELARSHPRRP
jgi:G3E family GTPase